MIKLDRVELDEKDDVKRFRSDVDEASLSDEETELERLVADLNQPFETGNGEETELERLVADFNQQNETSDQVDTEKSRSETSEAPDARYVRRCEQCEELFDTNDKTRHICFGYPGMSC